jgi:hypothetical protein
LLTAGLVGLLAISLGACASKVPLKESEQTLPVYNQDGRLVLGYVGVPAGTLATILQECHADLDRQKE